MKAEDREQLRLSLLRFLNANQTRFGLSETLLHQMARAEGRSTLELGEVSTALDYLEGKQLIYSVKKDVSPEVRAWRITAAGVDLSSAR